MNYLWLLCLIAECWGIQTIQPFGKEQLLKDPIKEENLKEKYPIDFGNPDINAKIERPCEVYDTFCIRSYLASHSRCKKTYGPVPDPLFRAQQTVDYPRANVSVIQQNLQYSGFNNGRIEEFYINRATDRLVIAIYLADVKISAAATYLKFYRRGQEPAVGTDKSFIAYGGVSLTVVIPHIDNLELENAQIFSYNEVAVPPVFIGPGSAEPIKSDPALAAQFAVFMADIPANVRDAFLTEGPFQAATYIQYNLCDFGLKVL